MKRMTLKEYAVKHKMSMFNVVKLVKSGELKSETFEEEGKNVLYIIPVDGDRIPIVNSEEKAVEQLPIRVALLEDEVKALRQEIEMLKKML